MMNVDHLENDEFVVECQLRGLRGTPKEQYVLLNKTVQEENECPVLRPNNPHILASKQPSREIVICSSKLKEFKDWMLQNSNENDIDMLSRIRSRIAHVLERLKRISKSKKVQKEAKELVEVCSKLKSLVHQAITDNKSLESSMNVINELQLEDADVLDDDGCDVALKPVEQNLVLANVSQPQIRNASVQSEPSRQIESLQRQLAFENAQPGTSTECNVPGSFNLVQKDQKLQISSAITELSEQNSELCSVLENIRQRIATNSRSRETNTHASHSSNANDVVSTENANFSQPPPVLNQPSVISSDNFQNNYPFHQRESYTRNFVPISKWNISFDGSRNGLSIDRFMYRVQHLAHANHISDARLVNDLCFLLSGDALEWYWVFIERNNSSVSWPKLHYEIKRRFQGNQCDDDVIQDIENRKQKWQSSQKETFLEFYSSILSLTLKLRHNYSDENLLSVLKRNMRPGLKLALVDQTILSVDELARRCTVLENMWDRIHYDPEANCQSKKSVNEMSYDCSSSDQHAHCSQVENHDYDSVCAFNAQRSQSYNHNFSRSQIQPHVQNVYKSPQTQLHCFNCHEFGHFMKNCPKVIPCAHCRNQFRTENFVPEQRSQGTPLLRHNNSVPTLKKPSQVDVAVNTELFQQES